LSTFTSRTSCFALVLAAVFAGVVFAALLAPDADLCDVSVLGLARPRALGAGVVAVLLRARFAGLDAVLLGARVVVRRALRDFGFASPSEWSDAERLPGGLLVTTAVGQS
jgi:hypothetical protein